MIHLKIYDLRFTDEIYLQADVWVELLQHFHYRQLVFIHSSDTDGRSLLGRLVVFIVILVFVIVIILYCTVIALLQTSIHTFVRYRWTVFVGQVWYCHWLFIFITKLLFAGQAKDNHHHHCTCKKYPTNPKAHADTKLSTIKTI